MDILNIKNLDIESEISKIIKELNITNFDGMCEVYANLIGEKLKEKGIMHRFVATDEYGSNYHHVFILAFDSDNIFLIDPTFRQFINTGGYLYKMDWFPGDLLKTRISNYDAFLENGYIKADNEILASYLYSFTKKENDLEIDNIISR